jgi:hypothetical protein
MSAPVELPPPSGLGPPGTVAHTAVPAPLPARSRRLPRAVLLLAGALAVLTVAACVSFALVAGRAARREHDTARSWQARAELQDELLRDADLQRATALEDVAELTAERDRLVAERDLARAEVEALRGALGTTQEQLAATEEQLAEVAGVEALARDRTALGG